MVDLHIHSTCSDGTLNPQQIIDEALANGVNTVSITDHDSIKAYTPELFDYATSRKVDLVVGAELSTRALGVGFHVLGYNFDINNIKLIKLLEKSNNARFEYLKNVSKAIEVLGYKVNTEKLSTIKSVAKSHIAKDIINNPINKDKLIEDFGHIPSMGEFIETIMNEGCPAYVEKTSITPKEASEIIHGANGKVVLAHPVANNQEDNISIEEMISLAKEMKADGIETYYLYINKNGVIVDKCKEYTRIAKDNGFFVTIGSDFHNYHNMMPNIGFANTSFSISELEIENMLRNIKY